jgi:hypothetical protein
VILESAIIPAVPILTGITHTIGSAVLDFRQF